VDWDEAGQLQILARRLRQHLDALLASLAHRPQTDGYVGDVAVAEQRLAGSLGASPDVILRRLRVPSLRGRRVLLASIEGLVSDQLLAGSVIAPVLDSTVDPADWDESVLRVAEVRPGRSWTAILLALARGDAALFVDDLPHCWLVSVAKLHQRDIGRPQTEITVRGPEDAFNELLGTQMALLRQRIADPALRFIVMSVGHLQHTQVAVVYLDGLTNPAWTETAVDRLRALDIDGRINATLVAGLIRDAPRSIFPTMRASERVDMAVWWLLSGKVLILVDGDPFVLAAPAPMADFYRTAADYSSSWVDASFSRCIRFGGWAMGVYLPALYIALTEVNPGLVPPALLVVIIGNHLGLPFPPITEALIMVVIIEILREAALRLPKNLGTTIGTVGAIVVGTAVVKAGIVSPQVIVVMTLTALAFFSTPVYELSSAWRIVGFLMMMAAAIFGLFGILLVTVLLVGELISMQSFGVPYLEPLAPIQARDLMDTVIRMPWTNWVWRLTTAKPLIPRFRTPRRPAGDGTSADGARDTRP
jgi:spore germination protein KA